MRAALFVLTWAMFMLLAPAAPLVGVSRTVATTARALVENGTLDVAGRGDAVSLPSTVVHDGRRRAETALGAALLLVPAEAMARAFAGVDPQLRLARALESGTAAAVVAFLCVLFFGALREEGLTPRAALEFTLLLAFATPLVWYARVPDGSALAALLLFVAVRAARAFAAADGKGATPTLGLALGLSLGALVIVQPTLLLAALVIVAWCGLHRHAPIRPASLVRVIGPLVAGIACVLLHRWHVGAAAEPMGDLVQGLDGLLLSTGKSIFLYAPICLLALPALAWMWRARRADAQLVLAVAAALLLAAAQLDDWHGDPTWGPRRALPLMPLAVETVALAWLARRSERRARRRATSAVALLAVAGIGVQLVGIAIAPSTYLDVATEVRLASGSPSWFGEQPSECHFIPQFSPIVGHAWLLSHLVRNDRRLDVDPPYKLLLASAPKLESVWPRLRVDWIGRDWSRAAAAAWLAALGAIAVAAALVLRRRVLR
ncbi:MAG: hypothetical protein JWN44_5278 [Myxococcales bacterium]|nr:hypothetical protein [Myxococcales bacterium]